MPHVDVNWWAVVVAAVINMVVGSVWYMPGVFGKTWSKLIGRKLEDMNKDAVPKYGLTALAALLQSYVLVHFVSFAQASTAKDGAITGLWLWVGFVAITAGVNSLFAGRPFKLWQIDSGYFLVVLVINGALLAVWH